VPQVVNAETVTEPRPAAGGHEDRAPPVGQAHDAADGHGEDELLGALAGNDLRDLDGQEPGQRDCPRLVRLRSAQNDAANYVGKGAADIDAATRAPLRPARRPGPSLAADSSADDGQVQRAVPSTRQNVWKRPPKLTTIAGSCGAAAQFVKLDHFWSACAKSGSARDTPSAEN
jgi:hypothetical protein